MNKTKNHLFPVTPNIFYANNDFHVFVPQNSTHEKTSNPNELPILNNGAYSFVVDWQLPGMGMGSVRKSYS